MVYISTHFQEEFIKRLTIAAQKQAEREKRTTVQKKDIGELYLILGHLHYVLTCLLSFAGLIVKRADEFFFLEGDYSNSCKYLAKTNHHPDILEAI